MISQHSSTSSSSSSIIGRRRELQTYDDDIPGIGHADVAGHDCASVSGRNRMQLRSVLVVLYPERANKWWRSYTDSLI